MSDNLNRWIIHTKRKIEGRGHFFAPRKRTVKITTTTKYYRVVVYEPTSHNGRLVALVDRQTGLVYAPLPSMRRGRCIGSVHKRESDAWNIAETHGYGRMIIRTLYRNRSDDNGRRSVSRRVSSAGPSSPGKEES